MGRVLLVLLFLALAAGLFILPAADPARIAALSLGKVASEHLGGHEKQPTLAAAILKSSAVRQDGPEQRILKLGRVHLQAADDSGNPRVAETRDELARRSLISALRQAAGDSNGSFALEVEGELESAAGGAEVTGVLDEAGLTATYRAPGEAAVTAALPGWKPPERESLLPPLIAILLAILLRRPVISLFAGVWTAAYLLKSAAGVDLPDAVLDSLVAVGREHFWAQFTDEGRAKIIGFVVAMLAMVGVMTRSGGIRGLMDLVAKLARNARRTQVATWLMGLVVFFDDYANCILVGSTMRPLSDRFKIAREKLAYLVDCTAAPVAGLSIFSTWIAFEVSTFSAQLPAAGMLPDEGYAVFLQTLPYRFYCILALLLAGIIAVSGRDFGPMLRAERRARGKGQLVRPGGKPMVSEAATALEPAPGITPRAFRALIPVGLFVAITLEEIFRVGFGAMQKADPTVSVDAIFTLKGITQLMGDGDSTGALLVGSTCGLLVAILLALKAGLGSEVLRAAWTTLRSMGIAIVILYLAWMIGAGCDSLGTAPYLTALVGDHLAPELLPAILFLMSALVAFSTGSSWSTMSILLPLVVGLAYTLGQDSDLGGRLLMVMSIGAVLEGSIFGDHCSPISDTTVLSSTASASDHIDHVRTQIPYALTVMLIALGVGYLPCAFTGSHPLLALAGAVAVLLAVVLLFGRRSSGSASLPDAGAA